jgi:hypothetical protein
MPGVFPDEDGDNKYHVLNFSLRVMNVKPDPFMSTFEKRRKYYSTIRIHSLKFGIQKTLRRTRPPFVFPEIFNRTDQADG